MQIRGADSSIDAVLSGRGSEDREGGTETMIIVGDGFSEWTGPSSNGRPIVSKRDGDWVAGNRRMAKGSELVSRSHTTQAGIN